MNREEHSSEASVTGSEADFSFYFASGRHDLREQYFTYDADSFVADVGGYMGLLLGHSLLSIVYKATQWCEGGGRGRSMTSAKSKVGGRN